MDNNVLDKIPGMGAAEEISVLYVIENYIADGNIYTIVDMEITGVVVSNIVVCVEIKGVVIETQGV